MDQRFIVADSARVGIGTLQTLHSVAINLSVEQVMVRLSHLQAKDCCKPIYTAIEHDRDHSTLPSLPNSAIIEGRNVTARKNDQAVAVPRIGRNVK